MRTLVKTHHLQLTDPSQLLRARSASDAYDLICIQAANPELNRFLYRSVGADWCWYERLNWPYERWMTYVCRAEVATWIATVGGSVAGYFELEDQDHGAVEIAYFGLLPAFIGSGLGAALLTDAAAAAWARGPQRCGCTPARWITRLRWATIGRGVFGYSKPWNVTKIYPPNRYRFVSGTCPSPRLL